MDNSRLVHLIKKHAILRGDFTLASGAKSDFYIDFSRMAWVPEGLDAILDNVMVALHGVVFDRIGGPMSGADPIIGAVMVAIARTHRVGRVISHQGVQGFVIRKEPKGRGPGAGEMYEGYLDAGDRVVLVEDVTTSGGSVMKAIKVVEARGAKVVRVITLLDRLAGASELLKDYDFVAITKLTDLGLDKPSPPPMYNI